MWAHVKPRAWRLRLESDTRQRMARIVIGSEIAGDIGHLCVLRGLDSDTIREVKPQRYRLSNGTEQFMYALGKLVT